jgi:hypothetical protein
MERYLYPLPGSDVPFVLDRHAQWHFPTKRGVEERRIGNQTPRDDAVLRQRRRTMPLDHQGKPDPHRPSMLSFPLYIHQPLTLAPLS